MIMNTYRKTAIVAGVLYIIGTVSGILSLVFIGPVQNAGNHLIAVSTNEDRVIFAALFVMSMGLALAMVPVVLLPVLKKYHETLAVGYVVFRGALETVTYMGITISWLLLIPVSRIYFQEGITDTLYWQSWSNLLLNTEELSTIGTAVFCLGALIFYYVLYQSKLVPRWLSGWGLVAILLYLAAGFLALFSLIEPMSTIHIALDMPLAVQEMALAGWLIVKGFNLPAIAAQSKNNN